MDDIRLQQKPDMFTKKIKQPYQPKRSRTQPSIIDIEMNEESDDLTLNQLDAKDQLIQQKNTEFNRSVELKIQDIKDEKFNNDFGQNWQDYAYPAD